MIDWCVNDKLACKLNRMMSGAVPDLTPRWGRGVKLNGPHSQSFG